jgi:cytoskeletal protein RodZ
VLIAIVAVAAFYEFAWPPALRTPAPAAPAPSAAPATSAVPLANPVGSEGAASAPAESTATISVPASPQTGDATQPPPTDASPAPAMAAAPTAPGTSLPNPLATPATLTTGAPAAATAPAASSTEPAAGRNLLALRFRGTSWIEVRDRSGSAVLSMTGSAGTTREITVATPGEVIVGNATVVDASWRGRALDLAGQAKQNVARMRLD